MWDLRVIETQVLMTHLCCLFYSFFTQIPVVNDDLPSRIISGRVLLKSNVKEFRGSSVVFVDGSIVDKVQCNSIDEENDYKENSLTFSCLYLCPFRWTWWCSPPGTTTASPSCRQTCRPSVATGCVSTSTCSPRRWPGPRWQWWASSTALGPSTPWQRCRAVWPPECLKVKCNTGGGRVSMSLPIWVAPRIISHYIQRLSSLEQFSKEPVLNDWFILHLICFSKETHQSTPMQILTEATHGLFLVRLFDMFA